MTISLLFLSFTLLFYHTMKWKLKKKLLVRNLISFWNFISAQSLSLEMKRIVLMAKNRHTHTHKGIELYMSNSTIANEEWKNDTRINWWKSKWTRVRAITREWEGANEKEMWNKIKWNWIILKIRFSLLPFFQRFYEIMISLSLLFYSLLRQHSLLRRIVGSVVVVETTPLMSNGFT